MRSPGSRGLNLFSRKYLLRAEHLLCVGCARSWEINLREGRVGVNWHVYGHCALLLLPSGWLAGEQAWHPHLDGHQGPDGHVAGGSVCPVPGDAVCTLCPQLWPPGMTGSVIDKFINVATRRGGRTGHFCLSAAVSGPKLHLLRVVTLQKGKWV